MLPTQKEPSGPTRPSLSRWCCCSFCRFTRVAQMFLTFALVFAQLSCSPITGTSSCASGTKFQQLSTPGTNGCGSGSIILPDPQPDDWPRATSSESMMVLRARRSRSATMRSALLCLSKTNGCVSRCGWWVATSSATTRRLTWAASWPLPPRLPSPLSPLRPPPLRPPRSPSYPRSTAPSGMSWATRAAIWSRVSLVCMVRPSRCAGRTGRA